MPSTTPTEINRLCAFFDVHVMKRKEWAPEGEAMSAFIAGIKYATTKSAHLLFPGDLWDRSVVHQIDRTGELPDECKRVLEALSEYKVATRNLIFHVDGNHDPRELIQHALPPSLIEHMGIDMQILQGEEEEDNGILVLHGHVLTRYFHHALKRLLESEPENRADECDALLHDPRVVQAARNVLTDVVAPPIFSMLHRIGLGDHAERIAFDGIERRRCKFAERYAKLLEQNEQIPFPSAKDTVGTTAELMRALRCRLGILGHTHRKFIEQRADQTIVNGGGGLRSDPWPRHFLDITNSTVALHAVNQEGEVTEGEGVVRWVGE